MTSSTGRCLRQLLQPMVRASSSSSLCLCPSWCVRDRPSSSSSLCLWLVRLLRVRWWRCCSRRAVCHAPYCTYKHTHTLAVVQGFTFDFVTVFCFFCFDLQWSVSVPRQSRWPWRRRRLQRPVRLSAPVNTATSASVMRWKTKKQGNVKRWSRVPTAADVVRVTADRNIACNIVQYSV